MLTTSFSWNDLLFMLDGAWVTLQLTFWSIILGSIAGVAAGALVHDPQAAAAQGLDEEAGVGDAQVLLLDQGLGQPGELGDPAGDPVARNWRRATGFSDRATSGCESDLPDSGAYDHPDTRV